MTNFEKYNDIIKTPEEIIKEIDKDYDTYVSHTLSHWIRDMEEIENYKMKKNMNILIDNKITSIDKWIEHNIEKYGAQGFYDILNDNSNYTLKEDILNVIKNIVKNQIKPTKIETIHDLAKLLNGNVYGNELENDVIDNIEDFCAERNWLIVYPYSDDNVELRGAYYDEFGAYDGTTIRFVKVGDFYMDEDDENSYHKASKNMFVPVNDEEIREIGKSIKESINDWKNYNGLIIEALWEPDGLSDYAWAYHALGNVDYAEFDILDEGEPWAKCMIIDLSNINK